MIKTKFWNVFLLFFTLLISAQCGSAQQITELIEPIVIDPFSNKMVIADDLFYSENYDLKFQINSDLFVNYDSDKHILKISPAPKFNGMTLLHFDLNGADYSIPVITRMINYHKFIFKPIKSYESISLFGSFNDWNRKEHYFTDQDGDGIYEIEIPLDPGTYQYKFFADGEELIDPTNPDSISNGMEGFNSIITIHESKEGNIFLHQNGCNITENNSEFSFIYQGISADVNLSGENVFALLGNHSLNRNEIEIEKDKIRITIPAHELTGRQMLRIAVSQNGFTSNIQTIVLNNGRPISNGDTFSWYDGIIYSLLIDRFNDGRPDLNDPIKHDSLFRKANYLGGDLKGITDKLDAGYFDSLGVNVIWISPVYDNPEEAYREYPAPHRWYSGYHGYWPISHTKVEKRFGSMDDVKLLVKKAHKHGIKILLDFVSNHVHIKHPVFTEHRDWFGKLKLPDGRLNLRFWDEFRLTTWFEPYLPSFDYLSSPEAVNYMCQNAVWWLNETGADGFRHDAVKHVPNEFWRTLSKRLKKEVQSKRDLSVYQIGETFGSYDLVSSYVNNGQLNAQFNFNLYNVAQAAFIDREFSFKDLDIDLKKTRSIYGPIHLMGNIMDSHDKNRFMAYTDGDLQLSQWSAIEEGWNNPPKVDDPLSYKKAALYYAYMMAIPGLPVIYYGSEFGMTGASDPDNRRMMRFGGELDDYEIEMLNNTKKLVNLRRDHTALRYGDYYPVYADKNIFAFLRSDMNERVLVVINKSKNLHRAELNLPGFYETEELIDLSAGEKIPCERSNVIVMMNGISWRYFSLK